MIEKTILLTGSSGFVGSEVLRQLDAKEVRLLSRNDPQKTNYVFCKGEINGSADYSSCLRGVDIVIHLAARAHVMNETAEDPAQKYNEVNTIGTLNLARQAAAAGVKRFVFLSSIKVNGESTKEGEAFTQRSPFDPSDPYGESKAKAEKGLMKLSLDSSMEIVIIRPPLVYGPGVKANFAAMLRLAKKNLPLPLGAINNKRSFVALDNLVDLIITCIEHVNAGNKTFLVSDNQDLSTTALLQMMTKVAGKSPILLPVPISWLRFIGSIIGKKSVIDRLCGNLQVDIGYTVEVLGWRPKVTVANAISKCIDSSVAR